MKKPWKDSERHKGPPRWYPWFQFFNVRQRLKMRAGKQILERHLAESTLSKEELTTKYREEEIALVRRRVFLNGLTSVLAAVLIVGLAFKSVSSLMEGKVWLTVALYALGSAFFARKCFEDVRRYRQLRKRYLELTVEAVHDL